MNKPIHDGVGNVVRRSFTWAARRILCGVFDRHRVDLVIYESQHEGVCGRCGLRNVLDARGDIHRDV